MCSEVGVEGAQLWLLDIIYCNSTPRPLATRQPRTWLGLGRRFVAAGSGARAARGRGVGGGVYGVVIGGEVAGLHGGASGGRGR